jgi:hypothetical protein
MVERVSFVLSCLDEYKALNENVDNVHSIGQRVVWIVVSLDSQKTSK